MTASLQDHLEHQIANDLGVPASLMKKPFAYPANGVSEDDANAAQDVWELILEAVKFYIVWHDSKSPTQIHLTLFLEHAVIHRCLANDFIQKPEQFREKFGASLLGFKPTFNAPHFRLE